MQFKMYWNEDNLYTQIINARLYYGFEYSKYYNSFNFFNNLVGSYHRLVITPLTDRVWMTISVAFQNKLIANPAGPAGTGKTECCKDFSKVLARYLIVYNCSS